MSSTLTNLTAATTWSGTDLFYALVGGNSRKIAASSFWTCDAANVLSDVNSTNAQTVRVYRTFTDSSNYERMALQSGSGYVEIAAETAGTGTDNISLRLTTAAGQVQTMTTNTWTNLAVGTQEHYLRTTGTAAPSLGQSVTYFVENASGTDAEAMRFDIAWDSQAGNATEGTETSYYQFRLRRAGAYTNTMKLDHVTSATQTSLSIYDHDNATLERVSVGAADSGGSGFKVLRIAN